LQVNIGISLAQQAPFPFLSSASKDLLKGLTFFEEWINNEYQWQVTLENGTVARLLFSIKVLENYGEGNLTTSTYTELYNDPTVDVVFGPVATSFSLLARSVSESFGRLILGTLVGAQEFYLGSAKAYSAYPSNSRYMLPSMSALRVAGARNVTMLIDSDPFNAGQCAGFKDNLADYGLEVRNEWHVPSVFTAEPSNETKVQLESALVGMMETDANVMVMCTDTPSLNYLLNLMKYKYQYTPKALIIGNINNNFPTIVDPELLVFTAGHVVLFPDIQFSDKWFGSFANYSNRIQTRFGSAPTAQIATGTVAGLMLANAITSARGSLDDNELALAMQRLNLDTFFGSYQFASDHSQLRSTILLQYLPDVASQIDLAPADPYITNLTAAVGVAGPSRIQQVQFVYPIPTWAEREYNADLTSTEWGLYALSIAASLISLVFLIYTIKHRNHRVMRASTFPFMVIILIGTIIGNSTIFTWRLTSNNIATCALTPILLGIGFVLTFGALFIKSWRIHMLFNEQSLKMFKISNVKLGLILMAFLLSEAALVIIIAVYQADIIMITPDTFRPSTWYLQCVDNEISFAFTIIVVVANGVLLMFGLYLAIRIRKLKRKLYNESRILAFIIYNIALLSVLVTILQFVGSVNREVLFIVRSLAIVIGNSVAVISLYANKIYYIRTLDNTSPNGTQTVQDTATSNLSNHISDSSVREQMDKLVKENQDLKQRLGEYEAKSKQSQVTSVAQTKEEKQEESSSSSSESSRSGSSPVSEQELVNPTP
jgi:hypothetical protein